MPARRPAEPGVPLADVATPALIVDLDGLERNIGRLADFVRERAGGVALRPHAKTHKSAAIARLQVAAGAIGICCQTVGEVEAMVAGGIGDVMLANEVATADKADRLARLAGRARISVCVDDPLQIRLLAEAARRHGAELDILVEMDVGGRRCGAPSLDATVALARAVTAEPGLRFAGLQAYHGRAQHLRTPAERRDAIAGAAALVRDASEALRGAGLGCPCITGAGTGTFEHEAASGIYTELQCGSYVFMDADYDRNERAPTTPAPAFEQTLFVLATVVSMATAERAVTDAGLKAISFDSGPPLVAAHPDVVHIGVSDEHSTLRTPADTALRVGDKLRFVPGHCDPTVNLHDWLVVCRDDQVVDLWPVARGGL